MQVRLLELVEELESYLPLLVDRRGTDSLANDCYEAADDWRHLGRRVLESDTRVNYPERARGERMLLNQLRAVLQDKPDLDQREYGPLLHAAAELIDIVGAVQLPEDGHLGFLKIVREQFAFLRSEFGLLIVDEQPTSIQFSSSAIHLQLAHSTCQSLSCVFGSNDSPSKSYWLDDLLYLSHDESYKSLPERLDLNTRAEVERWLVYVSGVLKRYGEPVFRNEPGIFEKLQQAQSERDAEIAREMERLHGGAPAHSES